MGGKQQQRGSGGGGGWRAGGGGGAAAAATVAACKSGRRCASHPIGGVRATFCAAAQLLETIVMTKVMACMLRGVTRGSARAGLGGRGYGGYMHACGTSHARLGCLHACMVLHNGAWCAWTTQSCTRQVILQL